MNIGKLSTEGTMIFDVLLIIIIAVIVAWVVAAIVTKKRKNMREPVEQVPASIIEMEEVTSGNAMAGRTSRNVALGMSYTKNYIVFRMENGDTLKFYVESGDCKNLRLNMRGILKYQGEKFISFTVS